MRVTQRQAMVLLTGLQVIGSLGLVVSLLRNGGGLIPILVCAISTPIYIVLMWLVLRGWNPARYLMIILLVLAVGVGVYEPFVSQQFAILIFLPPIIALTFANMAWVIGSAIAVLGILLARAGWQGVYTDPARLSPFIVMVVGLMVSRQVIDTARQEAEEHAHSSVEAQARAEHQAQELAQRNAELTEQNAQQRRLLDLVAALELPVIAVGDGALVAPLVGQLDQQRLDTLERRLLHEVAQQHAASVVLDVTGVTAMDSTAAEGLLRVTHAVRLLGARTIISGVNAPMAQTLVGLQMPLDGLDTVRDLRQALARLAQG